MPFGQAGGAYDAAVLELLQQAYNEACGEIGLEPHPSDRSRHADTREALASEIMDLAATGLRDPYILRERALQKVTRPTRPQTGHRAVKRLIDLYQRGRRSRSGGGAR